MNAAAFYFESAMARESTEIARGLRRRDPDLLDRLIEQYQHRLLRYLVSLTGRRELAEDLFQETWIRVLERGHQFNDKYAFSTWLFAVARNLAIDTMRRKQPASLDGLMSDEEDAVPFDVPATGQASAFRSDGAARAKRAHRGRACNISQRNTGKRWCFDFRRACRWMKSRAWHACR